MKKFITFVFAMATACFAFADALLPSQAAAEAAKLGDNETSATEYVVEGYVSGVLGTPVNGVQSFWMADDASAKEGEGVFEAYKCTVSEEVVAGDKVQVTGKITKYVNANSGSVTPEINGGVVVILEKAQRDENVVTFGAGEFAGQGVSSTGGEVSATKNGVTVAASKAYGDGQYGVRVYTGSSFSISSEKRIVKIVFEFATVSGKYYNGGLEEENCVEGTEWSVASMASQARCNSIKVYLGDGECSVVPPVVETITVAQAVEIGNALADGGKTTEKYVVEGYVVSSYPFDTEYNNQTFYMSDEMTGFGPLCAKWTTGDVVATITKDSEVTGDKVQVTGQIEKYNGNIQILRGVCKIISHSNLVSVKSSIKAKKVIKNGQFMIEANGVRYNMLGARF